MWEPEGPKPSKILWIAQAWKTSYPPFFDSSLHDFPWVPKGIFERLLIREGREPRDRGEAAKKQYCGLGAGSWFLLKLYT